MQRAAAIARAMMLLAFGFCFVDFPESSFDYIDFCSQ